MEHTIFIFLGVAVIIIALAIVLPRLFRKNDERARRGYDINADRRDGRGTATWVGIDRASGGDGGDGNG